MARTMNSTTLSVALTATDKRVTLGSNTSVKVGHILVIDKESILVNGIVNGSYVVGSSLVSGDVAEVQRGYNKSTPQAHAAAAVVWTGPGSDYSDKDPSGVPDSTAELVLPRVVTGSGNVWTIASNQWVQINVTPQAQQVKPVTASGGTARTLVAAQSGSLNLFDSAAGITYTLPAPVVGMVFEFLTTVLQTSSNHIVVTDAASTFLAGYVQTFSDVDITPSATLGPKSFAGNGTTHIKTTMNGTTLGGGIGTRLKFECISATVWHVSGIVRSPSGTIATPFST